VIYSIEKYKDIIGEINPLFLLLAEEVDLYPENPVPNVDHQQFIDMGGQIVCAREEGKLVGFHISAITNDIFYKHILTGYVLCYYLLSEYRGGGNGTKMFVYADESFKKSGVERVFMSRKIYVNNEKMFIKLGYKQLEANYTKCFTN